MEKRLAMLRKEPQLRDEDVELKNSAESGLSLEKRLKAEHRGSWILAKDFRTYLLEYQEPLMVWKGGVTWSGQRTQELFSGKMGTASTFAFYNFSLTPWQAGSHPNHFWLMWDIYNSKRPPSRIHSWGSRIWQMEAQAKVTDSCVHVMSYCFSFLVASELSL